MKRPPKGPAPAAPAGPPAPSACSPSSGHAKACAPRHLLRLGSGKEVDCTGVASAGAVRRGTAGDAGFGGAWM